MIKKFSRTYKNQSSTTALNLTVLLNFRNLVTYHRQALIYHQVRKYLLRIDKEKDHVKFWRPNLLLFTKNPKKDYQLIKYCSKLKKGGLYIIGNIKNGLP